MTPQAAPGSGRRGRVIRESREGTRIKRNFSGRSFAAIRVIRGLLSLAQKGNDTAPYLGRGVHAASACEKNAGRAFPPVSRCPGGTGLKPAPRYSFPRPG